MAGRDRPAGGDAGDHLPLLVIGGDADGFVPQTQTRALYAAARQAPRTLWIAPNIRRHKDIADSIAPDYRGRVLRFLEIALFAGEAARPRRS